MKYTVLIITLAMIFLSCNTNSKVSNVTNEVGKKTSSLKLEANFKGTFNDFSNKNLENYYLVDINLINNTDTICEFLSFTCLTSANCLISPNGYSILGKRCPSNFMERVTLRPNQEFSVPLIFCKNKNFDTNDDQVKFGFVLLTPEVLFSQTKMDVVLLDSMKKNQISVIWSEPINLERTHSDPWDIRQIVNDTSYLKIKEH